VKRPGPAVPHPWGQRHCEEIRGQSPAHAEPGNRAVVGLPATKRILGDAAPAPREGGQRGRQAVRVIEAAARGAALGEAEEIEVTVARFVCAGLSEPAAQPGVEAKGSTAPVARAAVVFGPLTARSVTRRS